ncbi:MAG TPA: class I SAM-dependent methyltransferase [Vicinamibacterales bacterium]|nr:class I SAM-dependent methyltransferase [Vicinamibacterales bacterium]
MKLTVAAENPLERVALALGIPPVALMDTHLSFLRARAIMVATRLGVFDALVSGASTADAVAARCETAPPATEKLLNALVGCGYLRFAAGRYRLAPQARKWLTSDSPHSIRDKVLFEFIEWALVERIEDYVRDGRPLDIHGWDSDDHWAHYQRAMRALAALAADEVVRRTPMPRGATRLLDVGGAHGYLSVAMCRRYPDLNAVVFDLPAAVKQAAPILAREGMGARVVHRAGDARSDDFGSGAWDVVLVSLLLHHFDAATNRDVLQRAARALRPGGACVVLEIVRPRSPNEAGQVGALLDLYYALTSESGTWSIDEMTRWQRDAGLTPQRLIRLRTAPGACEVIARK